MEIEKREFSSGIFTVCVGFLKPEEELPFQAVILSLNEEDLDPHADDYLELPAVYNKLLGWAIIQLENRVFDTPSLQNLANSIANWFLDQQVAHNI